LEVHPLTKKRWPDFETLFGPRGAYGGCWCMWWRTSRKEFADCQGEKNRLAMKALVDGGTVPGLIGYVDGRPAAWCALGPRDDFESINRSRVLKKLDDTPVWSLPCLFVGKDFRGRNLTEAMIRAAVDYVRRQGGKVVEAYPTVPRQGKLPPVSSFMGFPDVFARAGFVECARPSEARMIMRRVID
jgi:GNAT superfamily N-acetyltransferase